MAGEAERVGLIAFFTTGITFLVLFVVAGVEGSATILSAVGVVKVEGGEGEGGEGD